MRPIVWTLCSLSVIVATAATQSTVRRVPLQRAALAMVSPSTYRMGERLNPKTGQVQTYDPKPRVVTVDAPRGLVLLTWIGVDGKTKTITYQRPDAIDVVVRADALHVDSGTLHYTYDLEILRSSGEYLSSFVVQAFAKDLEPVRQTALYVGRMNAREFSDGQWTYFGAPESSPLNPGRRIRYQLRSSVGPGLVSCRVAGGPLAHEGAGEEMPAELSALLPGYKAWPQGYTIGPDDRLASLSPAQRALKLLEWLPEFERLGWMTAERRRHYNAGVRGGDLRALATEAEADLRAERITTEVRAILQGFVAALPKR